MPKRTLFTSITPLPPEVSREVAVAMLHNHDEMIELNPLVIEHHPIKTPRDAPADEFLDCVWQQLTDKIHYLPGGIVKGKVSYQACFHNLPRGLQTHIYAPMGLDIREKWSICGSLPGEPPEARELGVKVPSSGLYLREDGEMRCSRFLTSFVHKNLNNAHKVLVERILKKAQRIERHREAVAAATATAATTSAAVTKSGNQPLPPLPLTPSASVADFQPGSHMAESRIIYSPELNAHSPQAAAPSLSDHPAYHHHHHHHQSSSNHSQQLNRTWSSHTTIPSSSNKPLLPSSSSGAQSANPYLEQPNHSLPAAKQFIAELPGSLDIEARPPVMSPLFPPASSTSSPSPSTAPPAQRQSGGISEPNSNMNSNRNSNRSSSNNTNTNTHITNNHSASTNTSPNHHHHHHHHSRPQHHHAISRDSSSTTTTHMPVSTTTPAPALSSGHNSIQALDSHGGGHSSSGSGYVYNPQDFAPRQQQPQYQQQPQHQYLQYQSLSHYTTTNRPPSSPPPQQQQQQLLYTDDHNHNHNHAVYPGS